jgi:hypothetical protein
MAITQKSAPQSGAAGVGLLAPDTFGKKQLCRQAV